MQTARRMVRSVTLFPTPALILIQIATLKIAINVVVRAATPITAARASVTSHVRTLTICMLCCRPLTFFVKKYFEN